MELHSFPSPIDTVLFLLINVYNEWTKNRCYKPTKHQGYMFLIVYIHIAVEISLSPSQAVSRNNESVMSLSDSAP